ncbi:MAG: cysteine--tRNA ligase, partial [Opitutaceae bacterium]|nr:cysteine--tRNA ligase [Opitutaceae bacterium]
SRGYSPMAVRFALLSGHPRKQLNFTLDSLHAAESALRKLQAIADRVIAAAGRTTADFYDAAEILRHRSSPELASLGLSSLREDLNTPGALGELFSERPSSDPAHAAPINEFRSLARIIYALGLNLHPVTADAAEAPASVRQLADQRWAAKAARDFKTADALRAEISAAGWSMLDRKDGFSLEPKK